MLIFFQDQLFGYMWRKKEDMIETYKNTDI